VSLRDGGVATIHVSDVDAWNPVALPASGWRPTWSPDGEQIAFIGFERVGDTGIFVADADGRRQVNLSNRAGHDANPDWLDPAYTRSVSPAGRAAVMWGDLKRQSR